MAEVTVNESAVCDAHGIVEKSVTVTGADGSVTLCASALASYLEDLTGWKMRNMFAQMQVASNLRVPRLGRMLRNPRTRRKA